MDISRNQEAEGEGFLGAIENDGSVSWVVPGVFDFELTLTLRSMAFAQAQVEQQWQEVKKEELKCFKRDEF